MPLFAAIDIETTGLHPATDRIIEVAIVKFTNSETPTTWSSLVDPGIFIPTPTLELTRIPLADIRAAPPIEELATAITSFVGDATPMAHQAAFERGFFDAAAIALPPYWVDTLDMARERWPDLEHHTLTALAEHLALPYPIKHRAIPDADLCRKIYLTIQGLPIPELPPALEWTGTITSWQVTLRVEMGKPLITIRGL